MAKITKVPCFCQSHCTGGIPSEYSFVATTTRKKHELNEPNAVSRRQSFIHNYGLPCYGRLIGIKVPVLKLTTSFN